MTMTAADLEAVIARTGHERFRALTSDSNPDVGQRERYRGLVASLASGASPPSAPAFDPIPLAAARRATEIGFQNCWLSTQDESCGCTGVRCHLLGRIVSLRDCVDCLKP